MWHERLRIRIERPSSPAVGPKAINLRDQPIGYSIYADVGAPIVLAVRDFPQRGSSPGHGLHGEGLVSSS